MRQKMGNLLRITCTDIDLTSISNIEFYVSQVDFNGCYIPDVISATEMIVKIPAEDAAEWNSGKIELQFAYTDADGNPWASDVVEETVERLLKEATYAPI